MTFYFDECMSPNIVRALRLFGETSQSVRSTSDEFPGRSPNDHEWIPHIATRGLVIVTCDFAMGKGLGTSKPSLNAKILHAYRAKVFFMSPRYAGYAILKKVQIFFNAWPEIKALGPALAAGDIYDVTDAGKLVQRITANVTANTVASKTAPLAAAASAVP